MYTEFIVTTNLIQDVVAQLISTDSCLSILPLILEFISLISFRHLSDI